MNFLEPLLTFIATLWTACRRLVRRLFRRGAAKAPSRTPSSPPSTPRRAGPEAAEPEGGFLAGRFEEGEEGRDYRLFVPGGHAGRPLPLLVLLHGCGQDPEDFARGTRMNRLAEADGLFVLYPAQDRAVNKGRCWRWFDRAHQGRGGEPALLAGMVRQVMRHLPIDPARVYVAGLSAGGAMAAILGQAYPELFAAVGVHSGLPVEAAHGATTALIAMRFGPLSARSSRTQRPVIVFHGMDDTTVNPANAEAVLSQYGADALVGSIEEATAAPGARPSRRALYRDEAGRTLMEGWWIEGLGHAWAGGSSQGTFMDPNGPDASEEMLRFFHEHPRTVAAARAVA